MPSRERKTSLKKTKGGGAPEGAMSWSRATRSVLPPNRARARRRSQRGPLASRRSTAALAKALTPRLNPGPRFLELPGANGRTLPGASAASTSQTGRSAGRVDARSRPGAICETARGDRTRCRKTDRIRNAPFTSELCACNYIGDDNQDCVAVSVTLILAS
jgi:hypothetical protein